MSDSTTTNTTAETVAAAPATVLSRDDYRTQIFNTKPKGEVIDFCGLKLELREPPTSVVLDTQAAMGEDRKVAMAQLIIRYAYIPNTDIQVFEDSDVDSILALPFGKDMAGMNTTIQRLMGIGVTPEDKSGATE